MKKWCFLIMLTLLSFHSCTNEEQLTPISTGNAQADILVHAINEVKYSDVYKMKEYASQLLKMEGNEDAQLIGTIYNRIAEYFQYEVDSSIEDLEEIYSRLENEEYLPIRLEIDILLIEHFYLGNLFAEAAERLDFAIEYIFQPEFEIEKQVFLYGIITRYVHVDKRERLNKLLELSSELEDEPWSYLKSRLHHSIGLCHYYLGEKDKTKEVFESSLLNDLSSGILNQAIESYLFLALVVNDEKAIKYLHSAIELAKESGHARLIGMLHRNLGHHYFNLGDFEAARDSYRGAIEGDYFHAASAPSGVDYAYMGFAHFRLDTINNFEEAIRLMDEGYEVGVLSDDFVAEKISLERKWWILSAMGKDTEASVVENKLNEVLSRDQRDDQSIEDFYFNSRLKMLVKDNKIELLSENLALKSKLLFRQRVVLALLLVSTLFLGGLLYYYWERASMIKILKDRNLTIERQLKEIEQINGELKAKNVEQEVELKEKLFLLSNNELIVKKAIQEIRSEPKIPYAQGKKLLGILKSSSNKKVIEEIDFKFLKMHEDFQKRLVSKHPNLTSLNVKMSIYLKMNLTTKEIAALQFQTPESVKVSRSRLRKKLGLPSEMTLNTYMNSI